MTRQSSGIPLQQVVEVAKQKFRELSRFTHFAATTSVSQLGYVTTNH